MRPVFTNSLVRSLLRGTCLDNATTPYTFSIRMYGYSCGADTTDHKRNIFFPIVILHLFIFSHLLSYANNERSVSITEINDQFPWLINGTP